MKGIGLEINLMKSVVSLNGDTVEFAKKTYYQSDNVSGLPWKAVLKQTSIFGIGQTHSGYSMNIERFWVS
jgi:hypothetical protein